MISACVDIQHNTKIKKNTLYLRTFMKSINKWHKREGKSEFCIEKKQLPPPYISTEKLPPPTNA